MIVAVTTTVPAPVALAWLPLTAAPGAVLPAPKLHVIVWFVALMGLTVPFNITGVPAVPVVATPEMFVTGTKTGALTISVPTSVVVMALLFAVAVEETVMG